MLLIGLTGGIGSGKSTVAQHLRSHGIHLLDADVMAREVVQPGTPGLAEVVGRFGPEVLTSTGGLDRPALAAKVFGDPAARKDLEAITHPRVRALTAERLAALPPDAMAVHDVPLLVELGYAPRYHLVVIVAAAEDVRVDRLVRLRGMPEADAWARVRAQADDAARRRVADAWLDNSASPGELEESVDRLVRDRLEPFHANVLAGRVVPPGDELAAGAGEDLASRPARVEDRLRYVARLATRVSAGPGDRPGVTTAEVVVPEPDRAQTQRILGPAGFASYREGVLGSCDPGRPATVRLTGDPSG